MKAKQVGERLSDIILAAQPLFAAVIYLTFLIGNPPLWTSWCLALIPFALRFWRTGKLVKRTPFDIPILIFVAGLIVGFLVSPDTAISWQGLHTYLASILIYYGIVSNHKAKVNYWLIIGGILCLIILGLTIYTFSQGDNKYYFFNAWVEKLPKLIPKIGDFKPAYNTSGAALGIAVPLLFALVLFQRRSWLRGWITGILLLFLALLFLTGSGGAWLSAIVGSIFVLLCWKLWTLVLTLPVIGVGSWIVISSFNEASLLANTWVVKMFPLWSVESRIKFWQNTLDLLKGHIFTGLGLGSWYGLYLTRSPYPIMNPHNTYLQIYSDTGLFGGLAIISAAVVFVYICWHTLRLSPKKDWDGMAIGIIGSILAGMINAVFEVNTSAPITKDGSIVSYVAIPYLWFWAAFLVVAYYRLRLGHDKKISENEAKPG